MVVVLGVLVGGAVVVRGVLVGGVVRVLGVLVGGVVMVLGVLVDGGVVAWRGMTVVMLLYSSCTNLHHKNIIKNDN